MGVLCHQEKGIFPGIREIRLSCSCPDGAWLCKHLAAVLYGVGARLDDAPELLFTLRGVDGEDLLAEAGWVGGLGTGKAARGKIGHEHLEEIFGIDIEGAAKPVSGPARRGAGQRGPARSAQPRKTGRTGRKPGRGSSRRRG